MIIYKITNKINGKIYIGLSQKTEEEKENWYRLNFRHKDKNRAIFNAIKKYGWENFNFKQIDSGINLNELKEKERYWIKFYQSNKKEIGYNILPGGEISDWLQNLKGDKKKKYCQNMSKSCQGKTSNNKKTSKYLGVSKMKGRIKNPWLVGIKYQKKYYWKTISTELLAAECYDKMALFLHGENCVLNFPEKLSEYKLTNWDVFWNKTKKIS